MKLPKCPHCEKLLVMVVGDSMLMGTTTQPIHELAIRYLCPETVTEKKPDWVEVLEV